MAPPGSVHTEGDREVGLPRPRWPQEDDVLRLREEVELREVRHRLVLHRALEGEVEVVEGLHLREAGSLHPVLATVGVPSGDFLGEHRGEVGLVVPALLGGPLGEGRRAVVRCAAPSRPSRGRRSQRRAFS